MSLNSEKMTPLDVAGRAGAKSAAKVFLEYFEKKFQYVHQIFYPTK